MSNPYVAQPRGSTLTTEQMLRMYSQRVPTGPTRPPVLPRNDDLLRGDRERQSRQNVATRIIAGQGDVTQYPTGDEIMNAILSMVNPAGPGGGGGGSRGGGGGGGMGRPSAASINEAIKAMTDAATASQSRIGDIYGAANKTLAQLASEYAQSEQALRQGGGRTLGAFGVSGGMLDPMAQTAGDYLTASQGTLTGLSAAQQADLEAKKAAYALILGDMLKG